MKKTHTFRVGRREMVVDIETVDCDGVECIEAGVMGRAELRAAAGALEIEDVQGPELKAARRIIGLTQDRLGEELGVCKETVCRWETGSAPVPRSTVLAMRWLVARAMATP